MVLIPSPVINCHTYSDPLTPTSVTYFMDGPFSAKTLYCTYKIIIHKVIYVQYTFSIYIYIYIYIYMYIYIYIYIYIYNPIYKIIILYSYIYISIGYIYNFPCRFGVRIFLLYHSACRKRRLK